MFPENLRGYEPVSVKTGLNDIEMKIQIYDVINAMQVCFDVNDITFVSTYFWCVLSKTTQTKCVFPHF